MKSIPLNKEKKYEIRDTFLRNAFSAEEKELQEREYILNEEIYEDVFGEKKIKLMESLPSGWLPKCKEFKVFFGCSQHGSVCRPSLRKDRPFPYDVYGTYNTPPLKIYEEGCELYNKHKTLTDALADLKERKDKACTHMWTILGSVKTTKQLLAVWPECETIIGSLFDESSDRPVNLPAVPISELNSLLGL